MRAQHQVLRSTQAKDLSQNGYGTFDYSQKAEKGTPKIYVFCFCLGVGPKNTKVPHGYGLELVFGADCLFEVDALPIWGILRSISKGSPSSLTCPLLKGWCAANSGNPRSMPEGVPRIADLLATIKVDVL